MRHTLSSAVAALALGLAPAAVAEPVIYAVDMSFDDATFGVESAITDQGLVIDYVSHVGEMLERTRADVGSDIVLFEAANVYLFCSAVVSRRVMEADIDNVSHCPYGVFVRDMPGEGGVEIGYDSFPDGSMAPVNALLDAITREAAGIDAD